MIPIVATPPDSSSIHSDKMFHDRIFDDERATRVEDVVIDYVLIECPWSMMTFAW
jgi:D-alanine-D-alanine ligase-like ATP-grasp enzyme